MALSIWIVDTFCKGHNILSLEITSFICIVFALYVITIKNPISSILNLIGLFFVVACYLCFLGMTFIGLAYILVYVGAISVLFIFILMLLDIRVSDLTVNTTNSILLVIVVTIFFFFMSYYVSPYSEIYDIKHKYIEKFPLINYMVDSVDNYNIIDNDVNIASSSSWDSNMAYTSHVTTIGNMIYSSNIVWILLISWILLLAMVGCIMITL